MLYARKDSKLYESEFKKRFTNFCNKSPMLLSFVLTPSIVQVTDEGTETIYEFSWDYSVDVKEFIHGIKYILMKDGYPRIIKSIKEEVPVSVEEQTELIRNGTPVNEVPTKRIITSKMEYIIDKVIDYKDTFIIQNLETNEMFRYKLKKSAIFFLQKLRSGVFNSETGGDFFFRNSELLNKIEDKEKE